MTFLTNKQISMIRTTAEQIQADLLTKELQQKLDAAIKEFNDNLREENDILREIVEYCFYNYPRLEDWLFDEYNEELQEIEEDEEFNKLETVDRIIYLIKKHRMADV